MRRKDLISYPIKRISITLYVRKFMGFIYVSDYLIHILLSYLPLSSSPISSSHTCIFPLDFFAFCFFLTFLVFQQANHTHKNKIEGLQD